MARIHTGLKTAKFEKTSMVLSATVCSETGKRATTGCPNTYTEYFLWFTTPDMCDKHKGEEVKDESNSNVTNNNITEIVQGITEEIDEKEPPRTTEPTDTRNTINVTTNSTNTSSSNNTTNSVNNANSNSNTSRPQSRPNNNTNNNIEDNNNTPHNIQTNTNKPSQTTNTSQEDSNITEEDAVEEEYENSIDT